MLIFQQRILGSSPQCVGTNSQSRREVKCGGCTQTLLWESVRELSQAGWLRHYCKWFFHGHMCSIGGIVSPFRRKHTQRHLVVNTKIYFSINLNMFLRKYLIIQKNIRNPKEEISHSLCTFRWCSQLLAITIFLWTFYFFILALKMYHRNINLQYNQAVYLRPTSKVICRSKGEIFFIKTEITEIDFAKLTGLGSIASDLENHIIDCSDQVLLQQGHNYTTQI